MHLKLQSRESDDDSEDHCGIDGLHKTKDGGAVPVKSNRQFSIARVALWRRVFRVPKGATTPHRRSGSLWVAGLAIFLGLAALDFEPLAQAGCTGTSNCSNQTLTINNNLGGVGYSGNHVNIDSPVLTCGDGNSGGGYGGFDRSRGCHGPDDSFNDTSSTGNATGICLTPTNVNDPQCLRVPAGANTAFGFGIPPGGSNTSTFQSFNGGFNENDTGYDEGGDQDRGGYATTVTFGKAFTERIISTPNPSNPSQRVHTIQQTVGLNLGEGDAGGDRHGGRDGFTQNVTMTFSISAVTDSNGNLTGNQGTDSHCSAQPTGACGTFSFNIFDSRVPANCNGTTSSGVFTVVDPPYGGGGGGGSGGSATATFTAPTGASFTLACTTESGPNGCVGPVLDPAFYTPGGQFRIPPNCP